MDADDLDELRRGVVEFQVRVRPAAWDGSRSTAGTFLAVGVTDAGWVQCRYHGRDYGPTLHHRDLEKFPRSGDASEADRA